MTVFVFAVCLFFAWLILDYGESTARLKQNGISQANIAPLAAGQVIDAAAGRICTAGLFCALIYTTYSPIPTLTAVMPYFCGFAIGQMLTRQLYSAVFETESKPKAASRFVIMLLASIAVGFTTVQLLPHHSRFSTGTSLNYLAMLLVVDIFISAIAVAISPGLRLVRLVALIARRLGWGKVEAMSALVALRAEEGKRQSRSAGTTQTFSSYNLRTAEEAALHHDWPKVLYFAKQGLRSSR